MSANPTNHPARYTPVILDVMARTINEFKPDGSDTWTVLDPMAGAGGIHELMEVCDVDTIGIEIEPEWADAHPKTMLGDALDMPFPDEFFDVIAVSPTYGNRFADAHKAKDGSKRRSYTHNLRTLTGDPDRSLQPNNSGTLHGHQPEYWEFHIKAWAEADRVLTPGGLFLLNVSDYIRNGAPVHIVEGHGTILANLGYGLVTKLDIATPRMRHGANSDKRVPNESLLVARKFHQGGTP